MTNEQIEQLWREVFPKSKMIIRKNCLGAGYNYTGILASDINEVPHRILENDPLNYVFTFEGDKYSEWGASFHIKPDNPYMCYSSVHIRKRTIKACTPAKLKHRFEQIKAKIVEHKDDFINLQFNLDEKIGG